MQHSAFVQRNWGLRKLLMDPVPTRSVFWRRWLPWVALVFVCNIFGLIDAFQGYVAANSSGGSLAWSRAYPMSLIGWNLWALFVPLILMLVRRLPIDRGNWQRSIIVFVFAGIFVALARALIPVVINFFVLSNPKFLNSYLANKYFDLISDFLVAIVVYALILTFGQAQNYYKQYRENELNTRLLVGPATTILPPSFVPARLAMT